MFLCVVVFIITIVIVVVVSKACVEKIILSLSRSTKFPISGRFINQNSV